MLVAAHITKPKVHRLFYPALQSSMIESHLNQDLGTWGFSKSIVSSFKPSILWMVEKSDKPPKGWLFQPYEYWDVYHLSTGDSDFAGPSTVCLGCGCYPPVN